MQTTWTCRKGHSFSSREATPLCPICGGPASDPSAETGSLETEDFLSSSEAGATKVIERLGNRADA